MTRGIRITLFGALPIAVLALGTVALADGSRSGGRGDDGDRDNERGQSRVQKGFDLAPVKLNLKGKNRDLVGLGSYIVNAQGGCNDCHTCPSYAAGHDPYSGGDGAYNADNYLAGGAVFGPFVSRNITPDQTGMPAGLTRKEFVDLIRTGHDPDNPGQLLQVMPWPVYGRMLTRDLDAVYEYLSSIPHAEPSGADGCAPLPPPTASTHR